MRTVSIRLTLVLAVIFVMLCTSFIGVHNYQNTAYADSVSFDSTDVLEDLSSSTVNGQPFDIRDFPFDENKATSVFSFVEYCYSFRANMRSNYGLYIYVYNPQGLNFATNTQQNKIQMATEYDGDIPTRYDKFRLQYCGKVEESNYKGLFYKFKVANSESFLTKVNSNERRYDVSGIELLTYGSQNATEYGVGGTYKFTGYSKGYGPDAEAESTLNCDIEQLETCELEVHHTYFRTEGVSSLGSGHYNEVNTVYFELPNHFLRDYGNLQKIRAEWWEYKTKMMAITSNADFYAQLDANKGHLIEMYNSTEYPTYFNDSRVPYRLTANNHTGYGGSNWWDWSYNFHAYYGTQSTSTAKQYQNLLPLVFYSPAANSIDSVFDLLYSKSNAGNVEMSEVARKIYGYSNNLGNGYVEQREIYKDLFVDSIDSAREEQGIKMGYNDITIDLEDTFNLNSYDSNHSWWDKLWTFGFSWPSTSEEYQNVAPIKILSAGDLIGTSSTISKNLLVNENDVSDIQAKFAHAELNDCSVVLFRFANTDYYSCNAERRVAANNYDGYKEYRDDTYVAQMTVFLDFDIIELTFNKDGVYTVIPVVASPIDVINGITAPPKTLDWWKLLLACILLIILLILLAPVLPYIIKAIVWLITLPFKAVKKMKRKKEVKDNDKS